PLHDPVVEDPRRVVQDVRAPRRRVADRDPLLVVEVADGDARVVVIELDDRTGAPGGDDDVVAGDRVTGRDRAPGGAIDVDIAGRSAIFCVLPPSIVVRAWLTSISMTALAPAAVTTASLTVSASPGVAARVSRRSAETSPEAATTVPTFSSCTTSGLREQAPS